MLKKKLSIFTLLFACIYTGISTAASIALYRERVETRPCYYYEYNTYYRSRVNQLALEESIRQQQYFAMQQAARDREFWLQQERLRQQQRDFQLQQLQRNMNFCQTQLAPQAHKETPHAVQERYAETESRAKVSTLAPVYPAQPQRPISHVRVDDPPLSGAPTPSPKIEKAEKNEKFYPKVFCREQPVNHWEIPIVISLVTLAMLYLGYQYYYKQSPAAVTAH